MFLGILVGTVCLVGLVRTLKRRRWHRFHAAAHYGSCASATYDGPDFWGRHGAPRRGPWQGFLYSLMSRLDTTPGQEKAIVSAFDALKTTARDLRGPLRDARVDLARTVNGAEFDQSALDAAHAHVDGATQKMRDAVSRMLETIHGVLDEKQRKVLGHMIESGPAGY